MIGARTDMWYVPLLCYNMYYWFPEKNMHWEKDCCMDYDKFIEALQIFNKYENTGSFRTGKYEIWAGPDPEIVSEADKERLAELGWNDYGDFMFHYFVWSLLQWVSER